PGLANSLRVLIEDIAHFAISRFPTLGFVNRYHTHHHWDRDGRCKVGHTPEAAGPVARLDNNKNRSAPNGDNRQNNAAPLQGRCEPSGFTISWGIISI